MTNHKVFEGLSSDSAGAVGEEHNNPNTTHTTATSRTPSPSPQGSAVVDATVATSPQQEAASCEGVAAEKQGDNSQPLEEGGLVASSDATLPSPIIAATAADGDDEQSARVASAHPNATATAATTTASSSTTTTSTSTVSLATVGLLMKDVEDKLIFIEQHARRIVEGSARPDHGEEDGTAGGSSVGGSGVSLPKRLKPMLAAVRAANLHNNNTNSNSASVSISASSTPAAGRSRATTPVKTPRGGATGGGGGATSPRQTVSAATLSADKALLGKALMLEKARLLHGAGLTEGGLHQLYSLGKRLGAMVSANASMHLAAMSNGMNSMSASASAPSSPTKALDASVASSGGGGAVLVETMTDSIALAAVRRALRSNGGDCNAGENDLHTFMMSARGGEGADPDGDEGAAAADAILQKSLGGQTGLVDGMPPTSTNTTSSVQAVAVADIMNAAAVVGGGGAAVVAGNSAVAPLPMLLPNGPSYLVPSRIERYYSHARQYTYGPTPSSSSPSRSSSSSPARTRAAASASLGSAASSASLGIVAAPLTRELIDCFADVRMPFTLYLALYPPSLLTGGAGVGGDDATSPPRVSNSTYYADAPNARHGASASASLRPLAAVPMHHEQSAVRHLLAHLALLKGDLVSLGKLEQRVRREAAGLPQEEGDASNVNASVDGEEEYAADVEVCPAEEESNPQPSAVPAAAAGGGEAEGSAGPNPTVASAGDATKAGRGAGKCDEVAAVPSACISSSSSSAPAAVIAVPPPTATLSTAASPSDSFIDLLATIDERKRLRELLHQAATTTTTSSGAANADAIVATNTLRHSNAKTGASASSATVTVGGAAVNIPSLQSSSSSAPSSSSSSSSGLKELIDALHAAHSYVAQHVVGPLRVGRDDAVGRMATLSAAHAEEVVRLQHRILALLTAGEEKDVRIDQLEEAIRYMADRQRGAEEEEEEAKRAAQRQHAEERRVWADEKAALVAEQTALRTAMAEAKRKSERAEEAAAVGGHQPSSTTLLHFNRDIADGASASTQPGDHAEGGDVEEDASASSSCAGRRSRYAATPPRLALTPRGVKDTSASSSAVINGASSSSTADVAGRGAMGRPDGSSNHYPIHHHHETTAAGGDGHIVNNAKPSVVVGGPSPTPSAANTNSNTAVGLQGPVTGMRMEASAIRSAPILLAGGSGGMTTPSLTPRGGAAQSSNGGGDAHAEEECLPQTAAPHPHPHHSDAHYGQQQQQEEDGEEYQQQYQYQRRSRYHPRETAASALRAIHGRLRSASVDRERAERAALEDGAYADGHPSDVRVLRRCNSAGNGGGSSMPNRMRGGSAEESHANYSRADTSVASTAPYQRQSSAGRAPTPSSAAVNKNKGVSGGGGGGNYSPSPSVSSRFSAFSPTPSSRYQNHRADVSDVAPPTPTAVARRTASPFGGRGGSNPREVDPSAFRASSSEAAARETEERYRYYHHHHKRPSNYMSTGLTSSNIIKGGGTIGERVRGVGVGSGAKYGRSGSDSGAAFARRDSPASGAYDGQQHDAGGGEALLESVAPAPLSVSTAPKPILR